MANGKTNAAQAQLVPREPEPAPPASITAEEGMLRLAIDRGASIETIERLVALQDRMLARKAETEFNEALNRVQEKIKRIAPDATNSHTNSKWATYAAIDRVIRPVYSAEGFSLSFTHAESNKADHIRVVCWVRRKSHKEPYQVDWPVTTKGPKGTDVVTSVQATGISDSYAKRYLVKDIFNVAVGEDDTDGNGRSVDADKIEEYCRQMGEVNTLEELKAVFAKGWGEAQAVNDRKAMATLTQAKDSAKRRIADATC